MFRLIISALRCFPSLFTIGFYNLFHNPKKTSRVRAINKLGKYLRSVAKGLNVEYVISGRENLPNEQSYLICPNHQAAFDAPMMISLFENEPISMVAKKELEHVILVGELNRQIGSIFIDRTNLKTELKSMLSVKKSLETEDVKWIIFPEGTRTKDKVNFTMNEFKPGALKFPMKINKKIVPCAIFGTARVLSPKDKHWTYPIYVHFFPAITPEDYKDMSTQEVADMMQKMIQEKVNEFIQIDKNRNRK